MSRGTAFGALVHAVLAQAPFDADLDSLRLPREPKRARSPWMKSPPPLRRSGARRVLARTAGSRAPGGGVEEPAVAKRR